MRYQDYLQHLGFDGATGEYQLITMRLNDDYSRYVDDVQRTTEFDDLAIDHIDGVWLQNVPAGKLPTQLFALYREQKAQQMAYDVQEGRDELAAMRLHLAAFELQLHNAEQELIDYLTTE